MPTAYQVYKYKRKVIRRKSRAPLLLGCPQRKGVCSRVLVTSPKKPNSANRRIAKIILTQKKRLTAHIPGIGHNLQKHGSVLVRGGRVRDLPGVRYRLIRNKYDLGGIMYRYQGRSKYGSKMV